MNWIFSVYFKHSFNSMLCHFDESQKKKNDMNSFRYAATWHNQHTNSSIHDTNLSFTTHKTIFIDRRASCQCESWIFARDALRDDFQFTFESIYSPTLSILLMLRSSNKECSSKINKAIDRIIRIPKRAFFSSTNSRREWNSIDKILKQTI